MVSNIIEDGGVEFSHFTAGRKDGDKFDLTWVVTQLKQPILFRQAIARARPDVIHINTSFEPRSIVRDLVLAKAAGKRPVIVHIHGGRFVMEDLPAGGLGIAADSLLRSAARVVVLSDLERDRILERVPGLKVDVLPNAVSTSKFPQVERPWGMKNVIYLGRLQEAKGLSEMVEACRVLVGQGFKFRFSSYGAGPDQDEFVRRMTAVLGENYHHGGVVAGPEKVKALMSADVFLMPSRFEGMSLSLLEAMASGCVPIVSNRGSMPAVVEDGRNGFLVEPGDLTQIIGKMKFLLSEGETGWNALRQNARQTILDGFDLTEYSAKLRSIYSEAARDARASRDRSNR
jgi:glycosyltransferase involved in cell wall biosynthesis